MTQNLKCPFCGSDNPPENKLCSICFANLEDLPSELRIEDENVGEEVRLAQEAALNAENPNPDTVIPPWLHNKLTSSTPKKQASMPFDSYISLMFRGSDPSETDSGKAAETNTQNKKTASKSTDRSTPSLPKEKVSDPHNTDESPIQGENPLIIVNEEAGATNFSGSDDALHWDFSVYRPEKKWDDEAVQITAKENSVSKIEMDSRAITPEMAREIRLEENKASSGPETEKLPTEFLLPESLGAEVSAEPPLVAPNNNNDQNTVIEDDPTLHDCVSLTKLMDAEFFVPAKELKAEEETEPSFSQETLVSELLREVDTTENTSEPFTPPEGTFFFGNEFSEEASEDHKDEDQSEDDAPISLEAENSESLLLEQDPLGENSPSNIAVLDEILRHEGFLPDSEANPKPDKAEDNYTHPWETNNGVEVGSAIGGFSFNEPLSSLTQELLKEEELEEEEDLSQIPWNLFEDGAMILPHPPADSRRSAFRTSELPMSESNTDTSLRMIRVLLDRIIRSENTSHHRVKESRAGISLTSRCIWMAIAIMVVLIALLGNTVLPNSPDHTRGNEEAAAFIAALDQLSGETLIVVDYTPGTDAELTKPLYSVITKLKADHKLSILVMNPMSMPIAQKINRDFQESFDEIKFLPGGAVAIQSILAQEKLPPNIVLATADMISIRNWSEQLYGLTEPKRLLVLGATQVNQTIRPYLYSGMIFSVLCDSEGRNSLAADFIDSEQSLRERAAIWYLCVLAITAYFSGSLVVFLKQEPPAAKKRNKEPAAPTFDFKNLESDL